MSSLPHLLELFTGDMTNFLTGILRSYGDGENPNEVFMKALQKKNSEGEEIAMAMIFPDSPLLTFQYRYTYNEQIDFKAKEETFLHLLPRVDTTYTSGVAQRLIDCGINVNKQNSRGETALHLSIRFHQITDDNERNIKLIKVLLDNGANMETKTFDNRTALDHACMFGHLDIVELLLSRGAKINQGRISTLHCAVMGLNKDVIKLIILEKGVDVNYRCEYEKFRRGGPHYIRTPLELAIEVIKEDSICKDIVELLIKYGADVNTVDPVRKETPLHLACFSNKEFHYAVRKQWSSRPATIKLLLRHNANVNARDSRNCVPLYYVFGFYVLMIKENPTADYSNCFQPNLLALIAFFVVEIIARKQTLLLKDNTIWLNKKCTDSIYKQCIDELRRMNKNICESQNFSFLTILSKDIHFWGSALKNEDIRQVLTNGEYKEDFPIYAEYLEVRIQEATIRQRLIDSVIVPFQKHVNEKFFFDVISNIFKYLALDDLKNFAEACFVEIE